MEQPPEQTEKSFSFQGLREAYPHLDWPKMQLCCMPQLTCFYNPVGFTFAFKMFILISNYVYSMLQPPLFSLFYFMFYICPIFCLFLCQGQICFMWYSLSSKSSAYFEFFVQEMMIILILLLLFLSTFANLVEGLFSGIFNVTLEIDMIMPQWKLGYDNLEDG